MNVVGAAGFVVNGWWHGAMPSATLNVLVADDRPVRIHPHHEAAPGGKKQ
jgi:hypothetical protein